MEEDKPVPAPYQRRLLGKDSNNFRTRRPNACLAFADGEIVYGMGFGVPGVAIGEICFNTSMTGYQEILTDPSYSHQIIMFTFPHIGNVGCNSTDQESQLSLVHGVVVCNKPTEPSSWRSKQSLDEWMIKNRKIGVWGVDTRALTHKIRRSGLQNIAIAYEPSENLNPDSLVLQAKAYIGIEGMELAVSAAATKGEQS